MSIIRKYSRSKVTFECFVYEGSFIQCHLIYYPGRVQFIFQNFQSGFAQYSYEITRFVSYVSRNIFSLNEVDLGSIELDFENSSIF